MSEGSPSSTHSVSPADDHVADSALQNITHLVQRHSAGDTGAFDQAVELLYGELRRIAHRNRVKMGGNPTLHTTALVNEAYLKLKGSDSAVENSSHFLAIASRAIRQIIVDYARSKNAAKRGGDVLHVEFESTHKAVDAEVEQLLVVEDAIERLAKYNERLAKVFELKFYAGLSDDELALALSASKRTAQREWMKARAFIADYMAEV
ncbi:MAG: ECF-type sigma factor [Pseudomonadota bacterium]